MPTIFEQIMAGDAQAEIIHEDDFCVAFHDNDPKAPVHFLVVPRQPIPRLSETDEMDRDLLGHLMTTTVQIAQKLELENGYRVVINSGEDGGESVPHLHIHVLAGRKLNWPPG